MKTAILVQVLITLSFYANAQTYELNSPNIRDKIKISISNTIEYTIIHDNKELVGPSRIDMELKDIGFLGENPIVTNVNRKSVNDIVTPVVAIKSSTISEVYNELEINFKNRFTLIFRAYNNGVAYRFKTKLKKEILILNESVEINIDPESYVYFSKEESFLSMNEVPYLYRPVKEIEKNALSSLPILFKHSSETYILFTESDLDDYPGLWFKVDSLHGFEGVLPKVPTKLKDEGDCRDGQYVEKRANYIANTKGTRSFPWRVILIADQEKDLITNQMVYLLAKPPLKDNYSWIKPGMATLDWWGRRNMFNVDFKGGVNMETFKYFIDFNSEFGIPYFVFDDGWSDSCDIYKTNENLNLKEIFDYANDKGVGIILWINAHALKKDVKGILDYFASLGAKGIKVDFFNRDDQEMINLFHEIASEGLKRKLIIDFHGAAKPTGLIRTYPNVLTSEGLIEFEQSGVSENANPILHTTLPFIRMVAGPMDYLPGTMNNAQKKEFYLSGNRPVGLGSRSHSMALAVLFESPITMLPDSPSDYLQEKECTSFLTELPVTWDETKVIDAKIGEYVIIARRKGEDWFLGAITNWESREVDIPLDFLSDGNYYLTGFSDGLNTSTRARDYRKIEKNVNSKSVINVKMANGGGWVGKFSKE